MRNFYSSVCHAFGGVAYGRTGARGRKSHAPRKGCGRAKKGTIGPGRGGGGNPFVGKTKMI